MDEKEKLDMKNKEYDSISKSINKTKLIFYKASQLMVHIKLRSGDFRNGYVKEEFTPGVWKMKERKLGEINLFEDEIIKIEDYTELNCGERKT